MTIILYLLATLSANYLADWFVSIGPVLTSVGTLTFAATFTLRDRLHSRGRRTVYRTIAAATILNVVMAALLGVSWRIIGASFLAIVLSETADTEVYQRFLERSWWLRVLTSNAVSVPLDTVVFTLLAFYGVPDFTTPVLLSIIAGDIIVKFVIAGSIALWRPNSSTAPEATSNSLT